MTEKKSKLVMGTVQLGMKYGLNNVTGQPNTEEAFLMLDRAYREGINTFDTAYAYGDAEDVLGQWIGARQLAADVFIVSKFKPHVLEEYDTKTKPEDIVHMELTKSLRRLRLDRLNGYLLHTPEYLYVPDVVRGLRRMKELGLIENLGVSIYDEADALAALEIVVDYIQVPYNALDQRLDRTDFFERAKASGVTVFARSPFLQGLLLMDPDHIPSHLMYARAHVVLFREIAQRHDLTPLEASFLFAYASCRGDHIVFGAETLQQLDEILSVASQAESRHNNAFVKEIEAGFRDVERAVVNPSLWSTKK